MNETIEQAHTIASNVYFLNTSYIHNDNGNGDGKCDGDGDDKQVDMDDFSRVPLAKKTFGNVHSDWRGIVYEIVV